MLTFLTLGALAAGFVVLLMVLSLVGHVLGFLIALPFRIVGWAFKLVGFVLLAALALVAAFVAGGVMLLPLLPLALVVLGVVWLFRRRRVATS